MKEVFLLAPHYRCDFVVCAESVRREEMLFLVHFRQSRSINVNLQTLKREKRKEALFSFHSHQSHIINTVLQNSKIVLHLSYSYYMMGILMPTIC